MSAGRPGVTAEEAFCAEEYTTDCAKSGNRLGGVFRTGRMVPTGPVRIEYTKNRPVVRGEGVLVQPDEPDEDRAVGMAQPEAAGFLAGGLHTKVEWPIFGR